MRIFSILEVAIDNEVQYLLTSDTLLRPENRGPKRVVE
jgi:hypothetical protein